MRGRGLITPSYSIVSFPSGPLPPRSGAAEAPEPPRHGRCPCTPIHTLRMFHTALGHGACGRKNGRRVYRTTRVIEIGTDGTLLRTGFLMKRGAAAFFLPWQRPKIEQFTG